VFIIKFNNMIRNKWIWGIFAIIVAGAFVFSDVSCSKDPTDGAGSAGLLNGEPVSREEYTLIRQSVAFDSERTETDAQPERETWERLAALKLAKNLGITVADDELVGFIHSDRTFQDESGVFSPSVFRIVLERVQMTTRQYEEMLRRRIVLGRLESTLQAAAWIPPAVLNERVRGFTDSFTICTAVFSNSFVAAEMEVSDADIQRFYERNAELYREPDRLQVVYTAFKASDYLDQAAVSEDEVLDFYDANMSRYLVTGTNGVETTRPFEAVRKSIEDELALESAKRLAYLAAADFSDVFYTNHNEQVVFEDVAAAFGLTTLTSRLFSAKSSPVHIEASPAFVEAAFELDPDSSLNRFSEAVNGGVESYVMGFHTNVVSHILPLEKILPRVRAATKMDAAETAFRGALDAVVETIGEGVEAEKPFRELAESLGLSVSTNTVFSMMDAYGETDVPAPRQVAAAMAGMNTGEVSKAPIGTPDGALFFQVVSREPGDTMMFASIRNQARSSFLGNLSDLIWQEWKERTLVAMKPTATLIPLDRQPDPWSDDAGE